MAFPAALDLVRDRVRPKRERNNREAYRRKFEQVTPMLAEVLDVALPDAGFYLWAGVPGGDDVSFARGLLAQYNVTVLPGSLLARDHLRLIDESSTVDHLRTIDGARRRA